MFDTMRTPVSRLPHRPHWLRILYLALLARTAATRPGRADAGAGARARARRGGRLTRPLADEDRDLAPALHPLTADRLLAEHDALRLIRVLPFDVHVESKTIEGGACILLLLPHDVRHLDVSALVARNNQRDRRSAIGLRARLGVAVDHLAGIGGGVVPLVEAGRQPGVSDELCGLVSR